MQNRFNRLCFKLTALPSVFAAKNDLVMANLSSTLKWPFILSIALFALFSTSAYAQDVYDVYVYDGGSEPVTNAEIDLTPCGLGVQRTKSDGKLHFSLPSGTNCYMMVKKFDLQTVVSAVSPNGPRKISVALVPDRSGSFVGMVYDEATGAPLPRSTVYARSNTGTHWTKATTDQNGRYVLKLNGRQEYAVTFAHEGFADARTLLRTERDMANTPQLPAISLSPGSSKLLTWLANNPSGIPKVAPIGTLQPGSANGYTVQLASGPTNFADVASKYADLTKYGQLYTVPDGVDRYKLHLGVYATRKEAQSIVSQINVEFPGAFATAELNVSPNMIIQLGQPSASTAAREKTTAPAQYSTPSTTTMIMGEQPRRNVIAKGPTTQSAGNGEVRYAVQVGSFSTERAIAMNEFSRLDGLGNTYSKVENGALKVRVGLWNTSDQAEVTRRSAAARGFKDATIVTERADDPALQTYLVENEEPQPTPASATSGTRPVVYSYKQPAAKTTKTAKSVAKPSSTKATASNPYFIRIAALSNPDRFNAAPFEDLGSIEMRRQDNGMTVVLLGRYASVKAAEAARKKLRTQGYTDPYVVKEETGGKLTRM